MFLITGKSLKIYLSIFYGALIIYLLKGKLLCAAYSMIDPKCEIDEYLPFMIQIILQFFISNASLVIYLHIYKLIITLTDRKDEIFYIYQFMPLAIHQMILSSFQMVTMFLSFYDIESSINLERFIIIFYDISNHLLPIVISMSYIASRENLRYLIVGVVVPIFDRSSKSQVGVEFQQNL
ncbi:unnamed protein product [Caenorhabditis angaria]|uniref:Uncharacterized protein n=1 Tax=Caenorhabditis angaria TaxID=860376 RepID=A0A9P1N7X7_9PELO|nr:unnamed protein product [Caenorhabditis angaria]